MHVPLRQLPNVISSLRIFLVVPIAVTLWRHEFAATLVLFAVAAGSDAADGFIAKRFGWQTSLGAILDPLADKLMLATMFVMLALIDLIPDWLMQIVLARDSIIVLGAVAYRLACGELVMSPSQISKLNTLCQILFVLSVVARAQFALPAEPWVVGLGALAFVTTAVSGVDYVLVWARRARSHLRAGEA